MPKQKPSNQDEIKKIKEIYKGLFNSGSGRIVLEDLKKSLGYGRTIYVEKSSNNDLAFYQGRQSVINSIMEIITEE